jgi:hypothetical protein
VDQLHWRYEVIRPLVLLADRTAPQRAQETGTHPETVRQLRRRFCQQGMLGLLPADVEVVHRARTSPIPPAVQQEINRLEALYPDFHYRELARIVGYKVGYPIDDKTAKKLWHQSPVPSQPRLALGNYHTHPDRYQARLQVVKPYYQGWETRRISRWLHVSRPTVNAWIARFEAEHVAGLRDRKRGPKEPPRKVWLPRTKWVTTSWVIVSFGEPQYFTCRIAHRPILHSRAHHAGLGWSMWKEPPRRWTSPGAAMAGWSQAEGQRPALRFH